MSDKLEQIEEIVIATYDLGLDRSKCPVGKISKQILDICQPQWVSVDSPPKDGQRVVAIGLTSVGKEYTSVEITYWDKVGFISNITGWMPLPEDKP